MKTKILITACLLVVCSLIWVGCSENGDTTKQDPKEQTNAQQRIYSSDLSSYLSHFYGGASWRYGSSITETRSTQNYLIKEVIVGSDTRARGYVALDNSGQPAYFIDVNRSSKVMTSVDLVSEVSDTVTHIDADPFYGVNQYDFLAIIGEINHNGQNAYGGPAASGIVIHLPQFWGPGKDCGPSHWDGGFPPICVKTCTKFKVRFFMHFFIQTTTEESTDCNP
jgi:hypothetical protein